MSLSMSLSSKTRTVVEREVRGEKIKITPLTVAQMLAIQSGAIDATGWREIIATHVSHEGIQLGHDASELDTPVFAELQALVLQASAPDKKRLEALQGN